MKKLLTIVAALVMAATLTACSDSSDNRYTSARDDYVSYYDNASSIIADNKSNIDNNSSLPDNTVVNPPHTYQFTFVGAQHTGTYKGDWKNDAPNGSGTFVGTSSTNSKITATGAWKNGKLNGEGKVTIEYASTDTDEKSNTFEGQFVDSEPTGEIKWTIYYTDKYAAASGYDHIVFTGKWGGTSAEGLQKPFTAQAYKGNTLVDEGVVE